MALTTTLKTPGVYIHEYTPPQPPQVGQLQGHAVFMGYTETATDAKGKPLHLVPTLVKDMAEYESYFGTPPAPVLRGISLNHNQVLSTATIGSSHYLYHCLRLYFANQGQPCYIISIGSYLMPNGSPNTPAPTHYLGDSSGPSYVPGGLDALAQLKQPALLCLPDLALLNSQDYYNVQQHTLARCAKRLDAFALLDVPTSSNTYTGTEAFRQGIGLQHLAFGAAYTPWLMAQLPQDYRFRHIYTGIEAEDTWWQTILGKANDKTPEKMAKQAILDADDMASSQRNLRNGGQASSISAYWQQLTNAYHQAATPYTAWRQLLLALYQAGEAFNTWVGRSTFNPHTQEPAANSINPNLESDLGALINQAVDAAMAKLLVLDISAFTTVANAPAQPAIMDLPGLSNASGPTWPALAPLLTQVNQADYATLLSENEGTGYHHFKGLSTATDIQAAMNSTLLHLLQPLMYALEEALEAAQKAAQQHETSTSKRLFGSQPVINTAVQALNVHPMNLPPSPAVAAVATATDQASGPWVAPANIPLERVVAPALAVSDSQQGALNIDPVAGKSINALRHFNGRGTRIWGARTLAGNDSEWRYLNVRRLMGMVEKEMQKAVHWALFEANSANTWVALRGQAESYLNQLWRRGALSGTSPKEAYFVKVGLGESMTEQDILEGRLIMQLGLAVVRPAEFIVVTLKQQLNTS